jgi:hypothetical protein
VRRNQAQIDMPIVLEAMEKIKLGLRHQPLPPSDAKRRMAALLAARAVRRPPSLCSYIIIHVAARCHAVGTPSQACLLPPDELQTL